MIFRKQRKQTHKLFWRGARFRSWLIWRHWAVDQKPFAPHPRADISGLPKPYNASKIRKKWWLAKMSSPLLPSPTESLRPHLYTCNQNALQNATAGQDIPPRFPLPVFSTKCLSYNGNASKVHCYFLMVRMLTDIPAYIINSYSSLRGQIWGAEPSF